MTSEQYAEAYSTGFIRTVGFLMRNGVRRTEDAKDLAQDAWFRGWQRREELRRNIAVLGWVNAIARNLLRDYWRGHDAQRDALMPRWDPDEITLLHMGMPTATIDTFDMDRRKLMRMAPEADRELLRDYYVDGYSSPELSERWGANQNTVKIRIMRASDRLRKQVMA